MTSITLHADGTAIIANAVISSFLAPGSQTTFAIEENELAIYWERQETAIARFTIIDNDTLEFLSADVPLRAEVGARYVFYPDWRGIFGDIRQETDVDVEFSHEESTEVYSHEITENAHPFAVALAHFNANTTGDTKAFLVDVDGNNTAGMLVIDLYDFPMGTLFYLHNGVIHQADVGGQDAGFVSSMTVNGRRLVNMMSDGGDWSFTLFSINESGTLEAEFIIYVQGGFGEQNRYFMFTNPPPNFPWDNRYAITHDDYNELLSRYGLDNVRGAWWNMDDESNIIMNLQNDVAISFSATSQANHRVTVFSSDLPEGFSGFSIILHEAHALAAWTDENGFFTVSNNEPNRQFYLQIAQLIDYLTAEEWVYSMIERANVESQILADVDASRTYTPPTADFPFYAMERLPASDEGHLMQRFARDNGKGGIFLISIFLTEEQWEGWHGETLLSALASFEVHPDSGIFEQIEAAIRPQILADSRVDWGNFTVIAAEPVPRERDYFWFEAAQEYIDLSSALRYRTTLRFAQSLDEFLNLLEQMPWLEGLITRDGNYTIDISYFYFHETNGMLELAFVSC